jgi:hypothetical protein
MDLKAEAIEAYLDDQRRAKRMAEFQQQQFTATCHDYLAVVLRINADRIYVKKCGLNWTAFAVDQLDFIVGKFEGDMYAQYVVYESNGDICDSWTIINLEQLGQLLYNG